mgnify:FL=1
MKTLLIFVSFLIFQSGCDSTTETSPSSLANVFQVHLQWQFSKTPVTVFIDNSVIFSDTVSSSPMVGVAKIVPTKIVNGYHALRVTVLNSISKDTSFIVQDTLYIGVQYTKRDSLIEYYFTRKPFLYD